MSELVAQFVKRFKNGPSIAAELQMPADRSYVTAIFGASGCGKSTVLRCLAGLERPEEGTARWNGETWVDVTRGVFQTPQQRRVGLLFQGYALFPHMTIGENVAFPLPKGSAADRDRQVDRLLELFGLAGLADRFPHQISGGQQQRSALARTLASRPRLLLLDEPLTSLDSGLREQLRRQLRNWLEEFQVPSIVVTHDRVEALALADQLVVMENGRVVQAGPILEVFSRPASQSVAQLLGVENVLQGEIIETQEGLARVKVGPHVLIARAPAEVCRGVFVCLRAEDVAIHRVAGELGTVRNALTCKVASITKEGPLVMVTLDAGFMLLAAITRPACEELQVQAGDQVHASFKAMAVHLVPRPERK